MNMMTNDFSTISSNNLPKYPSSSLNVRETVFLAFLLFPFSAGFSFLGGVLFSFSFTGAAFTGEAKSFSCSPLLSTNKKLLISHDLDTNSE